ncbi:MAG: hypothetical protein EAZ55_13850 [Cytophagales bacterium]|nr:MAG: hypothetical protein EAZ55_13850 [Cytophagales bacterium]
MVFVFIIFACISVAMLYAVWFLPQNGKMLGFVERIFATAFLTPFLGIGWGGLFYLFVYVPTPIPNDEMANNIIKWYDFNKDGQIQMRREMSVIHCKNDISCRTYGYGNLFESADQNKDSLVSKAELLRIIQTFDSNHDQMMEEEERKKFSKQYPQYSSNGFRRESIGFKKEPVMEDE